MEFLLKFTCFIFISLKGEKKVFDGLPIKPDKENSYGLQMT